MDDPGERTFDLLQRWHSGDPDALNRILERNLPFIQGLVRKRLGAHLRARAETVDFMQDAMMEFLRYGPRFLLASEAHFRALMAKVVENVIRDRHDRFSAGRRDRRREQPLPERSVLGLDPMARSVTRPSQAAQRSEEEGWVRLALELLEPEDRQCIQLRVFEDLSFAEMGERLGVQEDAARMRYNRAMPRLARKVKQLRDGELEEALDSGT
jgi:RNA polymerase sigma factor (sigma-70 family)